MVPVVIGSELGSKTENKMYSNSRGKTERILKLKSVFTQQVTPYLLTQNLTLINTYLWI